VSSGPPDNASGPLPREVPGVPASLSGHYGFLSSKVQLRITAMVNTALEPLGITAKHLGLLTVIVHEGPIPQGRLGELLRIDRTTMVSLADELERGGYVDRSRNPEDRRAYALSATASGKKLQQRAHRLTQAAQDEALAPLSESEREELRRMMLLLVEAGTPLIS
jgi:DNA-binding MarR family transcriptional regulator